MLKKYAADIKLIALLLLAGVIFALALLCFAKQGGCVQVRRDGAVIATYDLAKDGTYLIENASGATNLLMIEDGKAFVKEASCPDAVCVHTGKISKNGQAIVCIPNGLVIEVISKEEADLDAVAY